MPYRPPQHRLRALPSQRPSDTDETRGSAASRGYDAAWRRLRLAFLMQHPLCEDCSGRGTVEAATEVHHIEKVRRRPELRLAWGNLMPLCDGCHNARTARGE